MKLLRTFYWLIAAIFATLLGAIRLPYYWFLKKTKRYELHQRLMHNYARWWGKVTMGATGSKVSVQGAETIPAGPVVFMANHLSAFDVMLFLGYIDKPLAFMAKKELAKAPIVSNLMGHVGCLFLDRKDARQAVRVFNLASEQIRRGHSMVIFPEGTRSKTGVVGDFKSGSMKLAMKANVPIVPVRVEGTDRVFENNGYRIGPAQISMTVLPPLLPAEYAEMGSNQVAKQVQLAVAHKAAGPAPGE